MLLIMSLRKILLLLLLLLHCFTEKHITMLTDNQIEEKAGIKGKILKTTSLNSAQIQSTVLIVNGM